MRRNSFGEFPKMASFDAFKSGCDAEDNECIHKKSTSKEIKYKQ